jgi:hypothetical protein
MLNTIGKAHFWTFWLFIVSWISTTPGITVFQIKVIVINTRNIFFGSGLSSLLALKVIKPGFVAAFFDGVVLSWKFKM